MPSTTSAGTAQTPSQGRDNPGDYYQIRTETQLDGLNHGWPIEGSAGVGSGLVRGLSRAGKVAVGS